MCLAGIGRAISIMFRYLLLLRLGSTDWVVVVLPVASGMFAANRRPSAALCSARWCIVAVGKVSNGIEIPKWRRRLAGDVGLVVVLAVQ